MRAAIIDENTGVVVNVILLPDTEEEKKRHGEYRSPKGCVIVASDWASPGDVWDGKDFSDPEGKRTANKPFDPNAEQ